MVTCLSRIVLAIICFPLLGSYGLRWAGRSLAEMAALAGLGQSLLVSMLDYAGAAIGLVFGVLFALALVPSACQRRDPALQATGDVLLLVLVAFFVAALVAPPPLAGTGAAAVLPPVSLVVWLATGAATMRLAALRRQQRVTERVPAERPRLGNGLADETQWRGGAG